MQRRLISNDMNQIEHIIDLAWELVRAAEETSRMNCDREEDALRAAIEQALNSQVPDGYVLVKSGALQMVVNALRRDAADGKTVRGEMADELIAVNHNHNDKQALKPGEPIGTKAWFDPATGAVITQNLYPSDVYTAPQPQQWVGLTDEDIDSTLSDPSIAEIHQGNWLVLPYAFARAIEAKLKEKNT
jgi:hypothetical protein